MRPENDQVAILRRMRREGRISKEEFEDLSGGLSSPGRASAPPDLEDQGNPDLGTAYLVSATEPEPDGEDEPTGGLQPAVSGPLFPPRLRQSLSTRYVAGLAILSFGLVTISSLGMLSWLVTIPATLLVLTTLFDGWRAVTFVGVLAWGALLLVGLAFSVAREPEPEPLVAATLPPRDPYPPVPGSLHVYMDQLPELWNTVDSSPQITKGLTRYNETGDYDTFLYRFGDWGRVAGAFDPADEAIYALLITGQFSGDATDQLYLHLCHVAAPYSQECIDAYHEEGLAGGTLEDFIGVAHEADWILGDQTWRLEIDGNVLTIRVYGPDAT